MRINIELLVAAPSDAQAEVTLNLAECWMAASICGMGAAAAALTIGLAPALKWLIAERSTRFGIAAESHVAPINSMRFDSDVESNVCRWCRSLHNVYKHAAATHAIVQRRREDTWSSRSPTMVRLRADDPPHDTTAHLGLVGMRERAALIGGGCTSDPLHGGARGVSEIAVL